MNGPHVDPCFVPPNFFLSNMVSNSHRFFFIRKLLPQVLIPLRMGRKKGSLAGPFRPWATWFFVQIFFEKVSFKGLASSQNCFT
jgi:hypothetical protein